MPGNDKAIKRIIIENEEILLFIRNNKTVYIIYNPCIISKSTLNGILFSKSKSVSFRNSK